MTDVKFIVAIGLSLIVSACGGKGETAAETASETVTPSVLAEAYKDNSKGFLTDAPDPCDVLTRARATEVLGLPLHPKVKLHRAEGLAGGVCSWDAMTGGASVDLHLNFYPRMTFDAQTMSAEDLRERASKYQGFPLEAIEIVDGPGKVNLMVRQDGMSMMLIYTGYGERAMGGVTRMSEAGVMATINENKPDSKYRDEQVQALAADLYTSLEGFLETR